jgi:hypothetical protein
LDLILEGEQIGKTAEEMLGTENLEGFCKEFINETRKGYSLIKRIYLEISYIPIVLLMFFGVFQMGEEWLTHCIEYGFDWNVRIDTGMVITTVFVLIIVKLLLTRTDIFYQIFESKCKKEHNKGLLLMIVSILLVATITILTKIYMAVYMFSINYFFALGMLALICVVQNVWENK